MSHTKKTKKELQEEVDSLKAKLAHLERAASGRDLEQAPSHDAQYVFEQIQKYLPICITQLTREGLVTLSLGQGLARWGLARNQLVGINLFETFPPYREYMAPALRGEAITYNSEGTFSDGKVWAFQNFVFPDTSNPEGGCFNISLDITDQVLVERKQRALEMQIQQAQKLESLGIMAGGIAHDFNNLLTGIMGNTELAQLELPSTSPALEFLKGISRASNRAADLCRQMLAYAGKGRYWTEALDLANMVTELQALLSSMIPEPIKISWQITADHCLIHADPTQIRQILTNLITNAVEAMTPTNETIPLPGTLTLSVGKHQVDAGGYSDASLESPLSQGTYAFLEVADTGNGMPAEILDKIFDPFFSTKFTGRGLGLAAVNGIIRSHKGKLSLHSELGLGTMVRIYFPCVTQEINEIKAEPQYSPGRLSNEGKILLIDDESQVRQVGRYMLQSLGYQVVTANNGAEGLAIAGQLNEQILLVILDFSRHGGIAMDLLAKFHKIRSDLPILLCGNYNDSELLPLLESKKVQGFLPKPLRLQTLRDRIDEILAPLASSEPT